MRYLGGKSRLLPQIDELLACHLDGDEHSFADLFAGSCVVGQYFKPKYTIISNDILNFSEVISRATISLNVRPSFSKLVSQGVKDPFQFLMTTMPDNYPGSFMTENYSPAGSAGRMFFTATNARRIDYTRETIESWKQSRLIDDDEFYYLLNSLIQAVPYISNTTGTYAAYLKSWDKRAFKDLELIPAKLYNNHQVNYTYRMDALLLAEQISPDIIYIDTPYNSRQYSSNYHLLETLALWDNPKLHGKTGQRDLDEAKSDFAVKAKAEAAMESLLKRLCARHVVVSYSTDGIISIDSLQALLRKYAIDGKLDIREISYKKYKSKIVNPKTSVKEMLFYFQPKRQPAHDDSPIVIHNSVSVKGKMDTVKRLDKKIGIHATGKEYGFIKSPLNYIGGKHKLLPQLFRFFPKTSDVFVDLFSGGANVGINVNADRVVFNDINTKVNEVFRYFQGKDPSELIAEIRDIIGEWGLTKENREAFIDFREHYNESGDPLELYVLTSYSFNYQMRFNNNLEFNNPFGYRRSHFSNRMAGNLVRFVNKLNSIDAIFQDLYFTKVDTSHLTERSFVYADPPYLITTGNYNDGNRGFVNWTQKQEHELYNMLDALDGRGIRFAMSNVLSHKGAVNESLQQWSKAYNVHHINASYAHSSYNTKPARSDEVLITNY
ncbi:Dam family site-specific DNA-(adenine-N6)-methyltransferase [Bifidobacterium sp. ESL0745]|uniref:Dam family site-specific DNA-(adenine-N6)-methyltransferase n=1 Tax=Bifidobacterium sp. ESL0745 TaxID=2983226 RepID=UPI0023F90659|nr:Dam family site-specific DNA-(adenine-N6)-methyltransferase [Bifidobacterium sp. ESL0745]MDF7665929.1 Dam family site-specific DNA-(adenine-N6)-methyltransferase [Bifidobacterium sp. ESL0745]